jgi:hypothetical protein
MSALTALLILRIVLVVVVYVFLALLVWMLWRDLRTAARVTNARTQRLGRLVVVESGTPLLATGTVFPLLPVSALGRAPTNTAPLPDETASLEHALLHLREGQWWLEDLDSHNGTWLNSVRLLTPTPVMPGDVIGIGQVKLKLEIE